MLSPISKYPSLQVVASVVPRSLVAMTLPVAGLFPAVHALALATLRHNVGERQGLAASKTATGSPLCV